MKVFVLVRNIHNNEEDTNYAIDLFKSYDEAYKKMNEEYTQAYQTSLIVDAGNRKPDLYTYHIYSNCAFIGHRYYNIEWEIHEKEINF